MTIFDTIAEKIFYQSEFYSGKDKFAKDENFEQKITWWVPDWFPAAQYDVNLRL